MDAERQYLKSAVGLDAGTSMPLARSFCQHVAADARPLIVEDAATHPLLHDNLATLEDGVRAYAGVPVHARGQALGAFCAVDYRPRTWSDRDLAMLKDLADSCADEIVVRLMRRRTAARWDST